jgi:hypothetical protein
MLCKGNRVISRYPHNRTVAQPPTSLQLARYLFDTGERYLKHECVSQRDGLELIDMIKAIVDKLRGYDKTK